MWYVETEWTDGASYRSEFSSGDRAINYFSDLRGADKLLKMTLVDDASDIQIVWKPKKAR